MILKKLALFTLFFFIVLTRNSLLYAEASKTNVNKLIPCCSEEFQDLFVKKPYIKNDRVIELQEALKILGYYSGIPSGIYDLETAEAVTKFQNKIGIAPDGRVRYHVWLKLSSEIEKLVERHKLPAPSGEVVIVIDTFTRKLIILNNNSLYAQFPVAIGKPETPSPIGNWKIVQKAQDWGTGFGTRWLGLNVSWGVYGIHGTNKPWAIGTMASHGCFRMFNKDVETIYPWVKVGTPVIVVGNPFGYMSGGLQRLNVGDTGAAVVYIQQKLRRYGLYEGHIDGRYGKATENAVKRLQKLHNLEQTGQVGVKEYDLMGIGK